MPDLSSWSRLQLPNLLADSEGVLMLLLYSYRERAHVFRSVLQAMAPGLGDLAGGMYLGDDTGFAVIYFGF